MTSEGDDWCSYRSSASSHSTASACNHLPPSHNKNSFLSTTTNNSEFNYVEYHFDSQQRCAKGNYSNRYSLHSFEPKSDYIEAQFNCYYSCPSVHFAVQEHFPPPPPLRKAESYLCVAHHIQKRAFVARQEYDSLLEYVINRQRKYQLSMEQLPVSSSVVLDSTKLSNQIDTSPQTDLPMASFTPPPPIDSRLERRETKDILLPTTLNSNKSPMFICSYDTPTDKISEHDHSSVTFVPATVKTINTNGVQQIPESKTTNPSDEKHCILTDHNALRSESNLSSSTLSASLLLSQDSDISPLPPHTVRVSPMNTDTMTPSSPPCQQLVCTDSSATYTCTSPAHSNYSEVVFLSSDLSTITINDFVDVQNCESSRNDMSPDHSESLDGQPPDTICVSPLHSERSPLHSERNTQSHSKTSDEPSLPSQSLSDSRKKSSEGPSDPTKSSSDRARRSSPGSSPDISLSSLPSDTITMNVGIESLGTDSDPYDNSPWSTGNIRNDTESPPSHDETDQTNDSAFASPSISPSFTKSRTVTPIPVELKEAPLLISNDDENLVDKESPAVREEDSEYIADVTNLDLVEQDNRLEINFQIDSVDEATENESIYPESECDIRLMSRTDTESVQRDSSPERQSTPIIAAICNLEQDNMSTESSKDNPTSLPPNEMSHRVLNEISSSGNSSMSNSPALSTEIVTQFSRRNGEELSNNSTTSNMYNIHLSNWLTNNDTSYNPNYNVTLIDDDALGQKDSYNLLNGNISENGIKTEEVPGESQNVSGFNGVRSFPYFGPLPTIHEVADTPTDHTPANEVCPFSPVDPPICCNDNQSNSSSSIISSFVHSDSPQDVSTTGSSSRSKNTPVPPPRIKLTQLRTPPVPPPPSDDDTINPYPLPPPPSEEDCLPPLPPPPVALLPITPPPIPAHGYPPIPPQRLYLLIPLAPGLRTPRVLLSPPPAPPRSTSLRRSSPPPPPPRSAVQTPSSLYRDMFQEVQTPDDEIDEDSRTASSPSDVSSVICVSKLTPVPEEKSSNNSSPLPPALILATSEYSTVNYNYKETTLLNCSEVSLNFITESSNKITGKDTISLPQTYTSSSPVDNFKTEISLPITPTNPNVTASSPPPPPPPRARISITPPLPPPPIPQVSFSTDLISQVKSGKIPAKTEQITAMIKDDNSEKKTSLAQNNPTPPPPPPPPKPKFPKSAHESPSQSRDNLMEPIQSREYLPEPSHPTCSSPLISISSYGKLVVDRSDIALPSPDEEVGRVFCSSVRWGLISEAVDTIALYTQLRPLIQHGPQCGLVALSMASQMCGGGSGSSTRRASVAPATPTTPTTPSGGVTFYGPSTFVSAAELLEAARVAGFSTHGEMFSASALCSLANDKLGDTVEAVVRRDVLSDKHTFLELMLAGALLLVPYDAQHNHQPGKYNGHKAHWCVVSGALVQSRQFASGPSSAAAFGRPDDRTDFLWHVRRGFHSSSSRPASRPSSRAASRPSSRGPSQSSAVSDAGAGVSRVLNDAKRDRSASPSSVRSKDMERVGRDMTPSRAGSSVSPNQVALTAFKQISPEEMDVLVLWRQGKSRLLVCSPLGDLSSSNAQLTEYPQAESDGGFENDFVIGNIEEGLAGQVVVLNKTTQAMTTLSELLDKLHT